MNAPFAVAEQRKALTSSTQTRVLVADDDPATCMVLEELLADTGCAVTIVGSGKEALARCADEPFDLVLLDIFMPGGDGIETCAGLRALPHGPRLAIVLMSASRDGDTRMRAAYSGADDFLSKPLDVTEAVLRVRSLVRLKRLRDDLDQRNAQLREQAAALIRAQEERRQVNAMIVHDLKGPLSVLLANVRFALSEQGLSADAREGLEEVVESGTEMHRMVLDLLDVDRGEEGKLVAHSTHCPVGELARGLERSAAARTRTSGHTFTLALPDVQATVWADPELLRRVLENLLDNAFKYAPGGTPVSLEVQPGEDAVRLVVRDQGPGVPLASRERIFDRYVRLERDADDHSHSCGLGLTFCKLAVRAMGGTIGVEDNSPGGAAFVVKLPVRGERG